MIPLLFVTLDAGDSPRRCHLSIVRPDGGLKIAAATFRDRWRRVAHNGGVQTFDYADAKPELLFIFNRGEARAWESAPPLS